MDQNKFDAIRSLAASETTRASALLEVAGKPRRSSDPPLWSGREIAPARCLEWQGSDELFGGFEGGDFAAVFCLHTNDLALWPEAAPGEALYLHKLAVRPESRGAGWTAAVVAWAAARARQRGIRGVRLDTVAGSRLVPFYESQGFRLVDKRPFRRDPHHLVFMELPIEAHRVPPPVGSIELMLCGICEAFEQ